MYKNNHFAVAQPLNVNAQRGVASLLLILLVGVSLTAVTLGLVATLRGFQDSSITSHAQTQAQIKALTGVNSLSAFLYSADLALLRGVDNGNIKNGGLTVATYKKSISCPSSGVVANPNYCFDVSASSGGATATVRMIYQSVATLSSNTLTGSVFAGGLVVGGNAKFLGDIGDPVEILVKGGVVKDTSGKDINSDLASKGITIGTYVPTTFVGPDALKPFANYTFEYDTVGKCQYNNIFLQQENESIPTPVSTPVSFPCNRYDGITYSNGVWIIDPSKNLPVGVLWFDKDVNIHMKEGATLVNTIVSKGNITGTSPAGGTGNNKVVVNSYAPYFYYQTTNTDHLTKVCGSALTGIPTQYCNIDATFKADDITNFPANMSNILFLTGAQLWLDASSNSILNYYGNVIASAGRGGTGGASGKFTGTGDINITGNLVISGEANVTEMQGNITIDLSKSKVTGSSAIPSYIFTNQLKFIRYM